MNVLLAIIVAIAFVIIAPLLGGLFMGCDRVLTARMQSRVGPPILQPFYDVAKLWHKEKAFNNPVETIFTTAYLVLMVLSGVMFTTGGNILLMVFALALAHTFLILAAYAANAPFSHIGAERELLSVMITEPVLILIAAGFYMISGSFQVIDLFKTDGSGIILLPGIFVALCFVILLRLRKSPYDISTSEHAHQELVKGVTTSFSGKNLAKVEIAHWFELVILVSLAILFFTHLLVFSAIMIIVCFSLLLIIDNVFPRVTWKMTMKSIWLITLFLGVLNLVLLGIFGVLL